MYTYSIFCVKAEIADHYYYKTGILYRFFKEFQENPNYNYLKLQYRYITEPLTLEMISSQLHRSDKRIEQEIRGKSIKLYYEDKTLVIYEDERHVKLSCASLEYAEACFLPILRQLPLYFFITRNSM